MKLSEYARFEGHQQKNGLSDDKLPSTSSRRAQRLFRRVKHDIETAVVQRFEAHPNTLFVVEKLDVSGMRFKSRRMNRYLHTLQIGHIQAHRYWMAAKRACRWSPSPPLIHRKVALTALTPTRLTALTSKRFAV